MWETTTPTVTINVNGVWIRRDAVLAIEPTVTREKVRVHLSGGTTVDVPLRPGETTTTVMHALAKEIEIP
ncbi:hypothetical protein ACXET9_07175 [Brachybacterium sp. DNPG3]